VGTGGGDVAGNSDFAPTEPEKQVFSLLDGQLHEVQSALGAIETGAVPAYNALLQKAGISLVTTVPPTPEAHTDQ
jgi:hypothetical protein